MHARAICWSADGSIMFQCTHCGACSFQPVNTAQRAMQQTWRGLASTAWSSLRHLRPTAAARPWRVGLLTRCQHSSTIPSSTGSSSPLPPSQVPYTPRPSHSTAAHHPVMLRHPLTTTLSDTAREPVNGAAVGATGRPQLILGIESSCDDTGVAIVSSDGRILGEALATQVGCSIEACTAAEGRRPCS